MAGEPSHRGAPARRRRGRPPHPDILTPREWQVLDLLRQALTNEQIAQRLDISFATAKYHVAEIISKLGVQTREEAAAWQPEAVAERWWQRATAPLLGTFHRLGPITIGKVGITAAALATLAGLAVLVGALLDGGNESEPQSAAANPSATSTRRPIRAVAVTASATPTPAPVPSSPTTGPALNARPAEATLTSSGDSLSWEQPSPDYRWRDGLYLWSTGREQLAFISRGVSGSWPQSWAGRSYDWSPDSQRVAYLSYDKSGSSTLTILSISGGTGFTYSIEPLTTATEIVWSPDGRFLAMTGYHRSPNYDEYYWGVLLLDIEQASSKLLLGQSGQEYSPDGSPTWSADSRRISVGRRTTNGIQKIAILDVDGQLVHEIADGKAPAWSPDGELLAYEVPGSGLLIAPADGSSQGVNIAHGYHAVWSPDGARIAYEGQDSANCQMLCVIDRYGGQPRPVTQGQTPSWSPDGSHIFFTREGNLFVTNVDTGFERQLTSSTLPFVADPLSSTNPDLIGFVWSPGAPWTIYTANVDGSDEQELVPGTGPRWSPDGSQLAFETGFYNLGTSGSLYIMRPDGTQINGLGPFSFTDSGGGCGLSFRWGTDGQHLAYTPTHNQLSIVSIAGQAIHTGPNPCIDLSPDFGRGAYLNVSSSTCSVSVVPLQSLGSVGPPLNPVGVPVWSPDGTRIAFLCGQTIAVTDANGENQRTITTLSSSGQPAAFYMTWSPDSRKLAYVSGGYLYVVDVDGGGPPVRMPKTGLEAYPIGPFDWSPDGTRIAFTAHNNSGQTEDRIFIVPADGSGDPSQVAYGGYPDWSPDGTRIAFTR